VSSDTTASALDSIDGALRDYEMSADAMRWVPESARCRVTAASDGSAYVRSPDITASWPELPPLTFLTAGQRELLGSLPGSPLRIGPAAALAAPGALPDFFREFARLVDGACRAVIVAVLPAAERAARQVHDLSAALAPAEHRRCLTCHPSRKPKPLAVNGHEYHRRQMARRRRRR